MEIKPFILGAIFARGGSKGLPGKNIRLLAGRPLIAYSIEVGRAMPLIDELIVSTDSQEIADVARHAGAHIPFLRPAEFAADTTPEILAWKHAITEMGRLRGRPVDVLVSIPTTSPLRQVVDVQACLDLLLKSDADVVITVTTAHRSPYFNMVTVDADENARLVIPPTTFLTHRQAAPMVYDMTTVAYAARAPYILSASSIMQGRVKAVVVPIERAIDIDTALDCEIAEYFIQKRSRGL